MRINLKHNPTLTQRAKELRRDMTKEERRLWYGFLRDYTPRFLRQKVIDTYIADFYCAKAGLVIELDGNQHSEREQYEYDLNRTEQMEIRGLKVLRIPNDKIWEDFAGVCHIIDLHVKERQNKERI